MHTMRYVSWLVWILLWPALPAQALTVNIDTEGRCDADSDECPAPSAVMFRTNISDANFLTWHCVWDFGDDDPVSGGTAEWAQSVHPTGSQLALKNKAVGPQAGHVYEGFASSPYTVTVTCDDGSTRGSDAQLVYIDDPDTQWARSNTLCVANGTLPVAGSGGCPSGASVSNSADWDAAVNSMKAADRRVLFKKGDSFVQDTSVVFANLTGPSMIGAYGTGALPIVTFPTQRDGTTGAALQLDNLNDWRFVDIDFNGVNSSKRGWWCEIEGCNGDGINTATTNVLALRNDILSPRAYIYHHRRAGNPDINADINFFIVEGAMEGAGVAGNVNSIFGGHDGGGVIGVDMNADTVHNIRLMCQLDQLVQHNNFGGTVSAGDDFRGCPTDLAASKRNIYSSNSFVSGGGLSMKRQPESGGAMDLQFILFESNLLDQTLQYRFSENITIRNNVWVKSNDSLIQLDIDYGDTSFENVVIVNNSMRATQTKLIDWIDRTNTCTANCVCANNLLYATVSTSEGCRSNVSGVTISNNINPSTSPYTSDPPTLRDHFKLDASGIRDAADKVTIFPGVPIDMSGSCRETGIGRGDVGAWESAGGSPGTPECIGTGGGGPSIPRAPILLD